MTTSRSPLSAVVFDWAGTLIDFGSLAPMGAFVELFAGHGVEISVAEARVPMGLPKWEHIRALGHQPRVAAAWALRHGREFDDRDVDALYAEFTPMNARAVRQHAELVPGVLQAVQALRARGLRAALRRDRQSVGIAGAPRARPRRRHRRARGRRCRIGHLQGRGGRRAARCRGR